MSYIGSHPAASFAKATSQTFTGDNSDVTFTLNKRVSNPEDLEVFVSNIQQQPTTSYTIDSDGVTLRFSEAPPSGQFYVVYRNLAQQTGIDTGAARLVGNNAFTGTITATGAIQGSQFNVGGNKVLEIVSWSLGNDTNKAVNTNYDYNTTLAAGTWLPFVNNDVGMFENHSNANSVGVYYAWSKLGSSSGGNEYGFLANSVNKWGNGANSYESGASRVFAPFTLGSSTTIYARWHCQELGTASNYWVRNYNFGYRFMRIG